MKPERWQRVEQISNAALELEPDKRESYLKAACAGDESLLKEVESPVNQSEAEGFLKEPAMEAAGKSLAREQEDSLARDLIGCIIAHYRIVEKIGRGGMLLDCRRLSERLMRCAPLTTIRRDPMCLWDFGLSDSTRTAVRLSRGSF